jgi:proteasome alpha subunit
MKPMEVEILVAEVGEAGSPDQLFHILYDGTVMDGGDFRVLGGDAEAIIARLNETYADGMALGDAVRIGCKALSGPDRELKCDDLEVAILSRSNGRRCFSRLSDDEVSALLAE